MTTEKEGKQVLVKRIRMVAEKFRVFGFRALLRLESGDERRYFIENLAMLLSAGLDVSQALSATESEVASPRLRQVVGTMREDVEIGVPLWQTLGKAALFPAYAVSLIRIGEQTGRLSESLAVVVAEQHKQAALRSRIRSIMAYPMVVLFFAVAIGITVAWVVLPRLALVFSQLRIELPLITRLLIDAGAFLGRYGGYVIPGMVFFFLIVVYVLFVSAPTKFIGQRLLLRTPGIGRLIKDVEIARLGYILGTLLMAGLPIVPALESLSQGAGFLAYRRFTQFLKECIEEGHTFHKAFSRYPHAERLLPIPIQQMIIVAERSGRLPETFLKIGELFENQAELTSKNLTVILEPLLLIFIWLGVAIVAMAVILPIYSLIGGISY